MPIVIRQPGEGPTVSVAGDLYRFLAVGGDTSERFAFWHATVPPGGGPPAHVHRRENEAFYVLKGELTFYALDEQKVVKGVPGFFIQLPPDRPHRFANESAEPAEVLILVAPAGLEKMFDEVGTASAVPIPMSPQEVARLMEAAPRYGVEILPPPQ